MAFCFFHDINIQISAAGSMGGDHSYPVNHNHISILRKKSKARKWLTVLGCSQLVIILIARIFLASPQISPITLETHLPEQWIPKLKKATEGKPIVFVNSYSRASIYRFYTGIKTHSYSILRGRKSQYFLKDFEANMQGENVYGATYYNKDLEILVRKNNSAIYGKAISNYYTFEKVKCIIDRDDFVLRKGRNEFQFKLANTYAKNITFDQVRFVGVFQGFRNKIITKVPLEIEFPESLGPHQEIVLNASFENPELDSKNELSFRVALDFYDLLEGYQGNKVPVSFEYITDNN